MKEVKICINILKNKNKSEMKDRYGYVRREPNLGLV